MLCHFLIRQKDHLNTKVKIMSSLSLSEAMEGFSEEKNEVIVNINAGKNVLTNIMIVYFYIKDNENIPHFTSVHSPSHINFNSYQART